MPDGNLERHRMVFTVMCQSQNTGSTLGIFVEKNHQNFFILNIVSYGLFTPYLFYLFILYVMNVIIKFSFTNNKYLLIKAKELHLSDYVDIDK